MAPPPGPDASGAVARLRAGSTGSKGDFYRILTAAVSDIAEHGFDSQERIAYWIEEIRRAAVSAMIAPHVLEQSLQETMRAIYRKTVERGEIFRFHPGVARFTVERLRPRLRAELDRRIMASADLIKRNRQEAIETTLRRFSGWATSIPAGGSDVVERGAVKTEIRKALASLPYAERRVAIDQGHKFRAALSDVIAKDGGAIAAVWHQHYTNNPRKAHTERDGKVFAVRGSWALESGLMKAGLAGYTDEVEQPGELVYCRCSYTFLYALRDLPDEMMTIKGRKALAEARERAA
jgi:hypothetical protein